MWISVCLISSFLHVTAGCTLSFTNYDEKEINVYSGQSVLLPCSCSKTQAKPPSFTWTKFRDHQTPEIISTQSDFYRGRVEVFNNTSPGNLSILLSDLTEDDQGLYRCQISHVKYRDIILTVKGADTVGTSGENNAIQYILLAALPVILIIAGVALYIYKRNKGKKNTGEKSSGNKTEGEKKDDSSATYSTIADRNTGLGDKTTIPLSAPVDPSVTYSTIVHMKGKRNAAVSLENGGETEYASIKTGRFS